ncbi:MAG TPA: hypothetical protein VF885_25875 [Arthrobacter sp.]
MSVWGRAEELRGDEGLYARLGVRRLQAGRPEEARSLFLDAALCRAQRYDFQAAGEIIGPLLDERSKMIAARLEAAKEADWSAARAAGRVS